MSSRLQSLPLPPHAESVTLEMLPPEISEALMRYRRVIRARYGVVVNVNQLYQTPSNYRAVLKFNGGQNGSRLVRVYYNVRTKAWRNSQR